MADQAQLVPDHFRRQDDPATGPAHDVRAGWLDDRRGTSESLCLCVAAGCGLRLRRTGRVRRNRVVPSVALLASVSLPTSPFPPLAVGFFGLGTGYLIWGPTELFGFPRRDKLVDYGTGVWGIWMPGFMQFLAGTYLFLGLTLFGTFKAKPLYMAAL